MFSIILHTSFYLLLCVEAKNGADSYNNFAGGKMYFLIASLILRYGGG